MSITPDRESKLNGPLLTGTLPVPSLSLLPLQPAPVYQSGLAAPWGERLRFKSPIDVNPPGNWLVWYSQDRSPYFPDLDPSDFHSFRCPSNNCPRIFTQKLKKLNSLSNQRCKHWTFSHTLNESYNHFRRYSSWPISLCNSYFFYASS